MIKLRYGNTNTFFLQGQNNTLLVDTDYAGTMPAFYQSIKSANIRVTDITYVLATHYHPDHMGLIGDLMNQGVKLLLIDTQVESVHFSDSIFHKEKLTFTPIQESAATVISCNESRDYLSSIGFHGEIIRLQSHSKDSVALVLDDGICLVGDTEPPDYAAAYEENDLLKKDWEHIMSFHPKTVFYAHRPEKTID